MRKWCVGAIVMAMLVAPAFGACPNKCSGHGRCGKNDVCDCMQNWTGGDCSGRVCPFARAWHDTAVGDDDAHYYAECSNRGVCDREKGVCDCDDPFSGSGCRRLGCPKDCNGHGTCEFIEELAANGYDPRIGGASGRKYTLWDQEKIMGCHCDPGWEGHECNQRVCPKGDDPLTTDQYEMSQAIVIDAETITGFLTYHDPYGGAWVTSKFDIGLFGDDATTCANIKNVLRRLPNNVLNTVAVAPATDFFPFLRTSKTASDGSIGGQISIGGTDKTICIVNFKSEPGTTGYQNLLSCDVSTHAVAGQHPKSDGSATANCLVYEVYPDATAVAASATRVLSELAECSNRGQCDSTTGLCKCYTGHMGLACQKQEALV
ncbi:hypothetical protein Poli38472_004608 [Pythium oligandrum]|uniref:EGF-like domain-containing protein n=1 Tax=Pythium oligandrum TaxID=41045 RepID=A0A8K1CAL7_PYTOL|nr:hypothetical protein Poli38472_004608 [Pythium oligandrum]|eukprot:TMW59539.1 hypothetical protein Poli38472_004608 [Pythium oligandrum]